jgi:uncharacterized protein YprB with RNaseH-like and TPR domain
MSIEITSMLNKELNNSENIAIDIETQGFDAANGAEITVVGFFPSSPKDTPLSLVNVGQDVDTISKQDMKSYLADCEIEDLRIILCDSEEVLLDTALRVIITKLGSNQRLVGYNAEKWTGGFDLPFLRTRFMKNNNIDWFFDGVYYCDIIHEVTTLFNTTHTSEGEESNDLDTVHELLCKDSITDPFETSEEAVSEYAKGNYGSVIHHCHSDVQRTLELFYQVLEYAPVRKPSDLKDSKYL